MSEEVETESSAEDKAQKRLVFPNLNQQSDGETEIVEHVSMSDIRDKMVAWVKKMREDPSFKVVFKADEDNADHTNALAYAMKFAETIRRKDQFKVDEEDNFANIINKNVFFKIVVPNYNNMSYIKKCLDSILMQTFKDFIVIVVDDLSMDGSDRFAKAYSKKFNSKIIFIKAKTKLYAGGCRNIGIDYNVNSKYTMFIDSDDWLYSKTSLADIYDLAMKANPKIIRAPMLHYFGENSPRNFKDKFTSVGKKYMFMTGPGPGRTIVRSDICAHFAENRSKCNDVVWFLKCIDQAPLSTDVVNLKSIWYVYNRASTTSCQNNASKMISKKCIDDQLALIDDLQTEKFSTTICQQLAAYKIDVSKKIYKPHMSIAECFKNAFFITIDQNRAISFNMLFKKHGLTPLPSMFHGCIDKSISIKQRCKQSHINVVEHAKKHNLPYVFIFEDDAYPCDQSVKILEQYLYAMPYDANLILFGWCNCTKNGTQFFSSPFNRIRTPTISGAHAYLLFKNGYDQYLNFFKNNPHKYADNDIFLAVNNSYIVNYPIFIQYSRASSMNKHVGYIFYGDHKTPPNKFKSIEHYLKQ